MVFMSVGALFCCNTIVLTLQNIPKSEKTTVGERILHAKQRE